MPEETKKEYWRVVAIEEKDGVIVRECIVDNASNYDEAKSRYLAGDYFPGQILDEKEEPLLDVEADEYILCIERVDG